MRRFRVLSCVVLSLSAFPLFAQCAFDFLDAESYTAGTQAASLATADFNNDGRLDLAVRINETDKIAILLASPDGGFQDPAEVSVGRRLVGDIAAGDINGDGKPDIVASNEWENDFTVYSALNVLWGNGDGTFDTGTHVDLYQNPYDTLIDDFNGDGKGDVALIKMTSFVLLLGTANGLVQKSDISIAGQSQFVPDEIIHGDFDNDGKLDVAVGDFVASVIHTFFGVGNGTFTVGPTLPYTNEDYWGDALAAGDFDGDGDDDIAFAEFDPSGDSAVTKKLAIYESNGAARTFATPVRFGDLGTEAGPNEAVAADVDGDGDLDVVVAKFYGIVVLLNDGTGSFDDQRSFGTSGFGLATGDFDRDGGTDVATSSFGSWVDVFRNYCGRVKLDLASSANPSNLGNSVTFTGTLTPPPTVAPTGGTLRLRRGDAVIAERNITAGLSLAKALADLPLGNTFITAEYTGDSRFIAASTTLKQVVQLPPFGAPAQLVATSTGGPVSLSWTGTRDVAQYEIWRSGAGSAWAQIGTTAAMEYVDSTAPSSAACIYKVRAVKADATQSPFSNADLASTFSFTDETLTTGVTRVKRAHLVELRTAVAAARAAAGLTAVTWAESSPVVVKASHWTELRNALEPVRTALAMAAGTYTATPAAGQKVLAVHVTQLRANLR